MSDTHVLLRRLWLFARIVWRIDQTEHRMAASTAWEVARIVWPTSKEEIITGFGSIWGSGDPADLAPGYDRDEVRRLEREIELEGNNRFTGWPIVRRPHASGAGGNVQPQLSKRTEDMVGNQSGPHKPERPIGTG